MRPSSYSSSTTSTVLRKWTLRIEAIVSRAVIVVVIWDFDGNVPGGHVIRGHGSAIRGFAYSISPMNEMSSWSGGQKMAGIPPMVNGKGLGGVEVVHVKYGNAQETLVKLYASNIHLNWSAVGSVNRRWLLL